MKDKSTQMWIPLYVDKWIFGSTRIELEPAERGVFIDLMVLGAKDEGFIRANETTPFLQVQLAGLLNIPIDLLKSTIAKCIAFGKLEEHAQGIYRLCNWDKYQLSDDYRYRISTGRKQIPGLASPSFSDSSPKITKKSGPIREEKRVEEKREEDTTTSAGAVESEASKAVNWENCKTDSQRLMAKYIKQTQPAVYASATVTQATAHFKRHGKALKSILEQAGSVDIALRVIDLAQAYYEKKGFDWNLDTVDRACGDFINLALKEKH